MNEIPVSFLQVIGGMFLGLLLKSWWKKSPTETAYMTEEDCQKCRSECQKQRQADRNDLREEVRNLGRSIDELRKMIIDMLRARV